MVIKPTFYVSTVQVRVTIRATVRVNCKTMGDPQVITEENMLDEL